MKPRYWIKIYCKFDQTDSKYQPSWKFSMMPQNAQKQVIAVDKTTAIQPTIRCHLLVGLLSITQVLAST